MHTSDAAEIYYTWHGHTINTKKNNFVSDFSSCYFYFIFPTYIERNNETRGWYDVNNRVLPDQIKSIKLNYLPYTSYFNKHMILKGC